MDNRKLKGAGFTYRFTTAGAVQSFAEAERLRRVVGETRPTYRYESDVESFFRHSPAVVRALTARLRRYSRGRIQSRRYWSLRCAQSSAVMA